MVSEYSKSGVDLNKLRSYHSFISSYLSSSDLPIKIGHYAGAIKLGDKYIVMHVDGVGTKTLLALKTGIIEPTGIDCVAMNVNDIACVGAKPIALVDYLALEKPMDDVVEKVLRGLKHGAEESQAIIVGGETAIMPGVITGYDLSCSVVGVADKLKTGQDVKPGDVILGLASNGIHSNGYSLVRKLIDEGKISLEKWADELLKPTKIYSNSVLSILDKIKAAAHITGGSFTKLRRITNYRISIRLPDPPEVFKVIENGGVSHEEMHKVFNMGIGMVLFVSKENVEEIIKTLEGKEKVMELGKVEEGEGIKITTYRGQVLNL
ncbi:phosphoribosylformylglycinamidine cyclo-ligase [Stygiolobus azoricus]|uniref:Phosphoribosylformylglycinamidine cyclo-ligase n=1 Tax=Stygiolobus azoricus TaxID=41675 RepID=A0A650CP56_9CREN|nr:phosphoribosylformylglycinamidine cyclo-ligase [Stygiolobus azoricus]QGR19485.1 phosphoribosylformylglycinamidine cyclo-ligase [Stygiolobus azoricus]